MENTANRVYLCGNLVGLPAYSHENHGKRFYRFTLEVPRLSGTADALQVIVPEQTLHAAEITDGSVIAVTGQIRSFNSRQETGRKLIISVYAESMEICECEPANEVELIGSICKVPVYRRTPLGREICDVMLAVNRTYHRTDYLPCILWGRTAQEVSQMGVGTKLHLLGRLQSREYIKVLDTGNEKRVAYEISAIAADPVDEVSENVE